MIDKLRDIRVILVILLVLTYVTVFLVGYLYITSTNKTLGEKDTKILQLEDSLKQIGELVPAFTIASDVRMGKKIEETDLVQIEVPVSMSKNLIQDKNELIGKFYKTNLTAGTVLTTDVVYDFELTDDMRLFDVVLHNIPVGLKPGSYVDVRIAMPMGEDFIALAHKRVYDINAGVLKLAVTEKDIHTYNSMLIDSLIYPGTKLYAVEYIEAGAQKPADVYYPISKNVLAVAQKDPNLLEAIKSDILKRREVLEASLQGILPDDETSGREELDKILERGREKYSALILEAERENQRKEQKLEEERKRQENQQQQQNNSGNPQGLEQL